MGERWWHRRARTEAAAGEIPAASVAEVIRACQRWRRWDTPTATATDLIYAAAGRAVLRALGFTIPPEGTEVSGPAAYGQGAVIGEPAPDASLPPVGGGYSANVSYAGGNGHAGNGAGGGGHGGQVYAAGGAGGIAGGGSAFGPSFGGNAGGPPFAVNADPARPGQVWRGEPVPEPGHEPGTWHGRSANDARAAAGVAEPVDDRARAWVAAHGDVPVYPALVEGEWGSWENRPGQGPPGDPPEDGAWHADAHP